MLQAQRVKVILTANEIVIAWQWSDGTRCVLCDVGNNQLELHVVRDGQTLRREPVGDIARALGTTARELEVELLGDRTQPTT
jgi:hypothetical protein